MASVNRYDVEPESAFTLATHPRMGLARLVIHLHGQLEYLNRAFWINELADRLAINEEATAVRAQLAAIEDVSRWVALGYTAAAAELADDLGVWA